MSNEKHAQAILEGYEGPFFPPSVDDLREQLDQAESFNAYRLRTIFDNLEGFAGTGQPYTSDGYFWFCSLGFVKKRGLVIVLIPWSQDWDKRDGTMSDRSIAVHLLGTDEADAEEIVQRLVVATRAATTPQSVRQ